MLGWIVIAICFFGAVAVFVTNKFCSKAVIHKLIAAITVALLIALGLFGVVEPILFPPETMPIAVTATGEPNNLTASSEVYIKRVVVDDKTYIPQSIFDKIWVTDPDGRNYYGWRDYDPVDLPDTVNGAVPLGKNISIVFQKNQWRGSAIVTLGDERQTVDCAYDTSEDWDQTVEFSFNGYVAKAVSFPQKLIPFAIVFVLSLAVLVSLLVFEKRKATGNAAVQDTEKTGTEKQREIAGDLLRVVAAFTIVWLHATCNIYNNYTENMQVWYGYLYVNSFTSFAVPCFFMLSGAFLLRKKQSVDVVLKSRVPSILIPLVSWTLVYVLVRKFAMSETINVLTSLAKAIFSEQFTTLWFLYSLLGIYILLPVLSEWYTRAGDKEKWVVLACVYLVPVLLATIAEVALGSFTFPQWAKLFTDSSVFILGAVIYERSSKSSWKLWFIVAIIGFCLVVAGSYHVSVMNGMPTKTFFSWTLLPNTVFAAGVFGTFIALEGVLQVRISASARRRISFLSKLTFGVYLVHPLFVTVFTDLPIGIFSLKSNAGTQLGMLAYTVIWLIASLSISYVLSRIPFLRRII